MESGKRRLPGLRGVGLDELEQISGEGQYRITFHQGQVALVEIWRDGARIALGKTRCEGPCARCGRVMGLYEPTNATMEVCDRCEQQLAATKGEG